MIFPMTKMLLLKLIKFFAGLESMLSLHSWVKENLQGPVIIVIDIIVIILFFFICLYIYKRFIKKQDLSYVKLYEFKFNDHKFKIHNNYINNKTFIKDISISEVVNKSEKKFGIIFVLMLRKKIPDDYEIALKDTKKNIHITTLYDNDKTYIFSADIKNDIKYSIFISPEYVKESKIN